MLTHHRRRARRGISLAELLVTCALTGLIGAVVLRTTVRQERFYQAIAQIVATRGAVYDAANLLRHELRGVAPASGGIYALGPDAVDVRAPLGASVICSIDASRTTIGIPPHLDAPRSLTAWTTELQVGDTVLVYAAEPPDSARWLAHVVTASPERGGDCPTASGFALTAADAGAALALRLAPPLPPLVGPGAALRFVRRTRYALYRAADARWYLGVSDCLPTRATPCTALQPVSGPFDAGGVRFVYRDSADAETNDPARVARIEIVLRSDSRAPLRAEGFTLGPFRDSLTLPITLRNP
ncbi:MAG: hypothetical protein IRY91_04920 [Gemmatimonadaceae bacterium]|nr:hypothetical protein [Gemmatimonadaceae bacterium]